MALKKLTAYALLALAVGSIVVGVGMLSSPVGLIVSGCILLVALIGPDGWRR